MNSHQAFGTSEDFRYSAECGRLANLVRPHRRDRKIKPKHSIQIPVGRMFLASSLVAAVAALIQQTQF